MADPTKGDKSNQEKTVPLSQLMALKEKEKKTRAELEEAKTSNAKLTSELKIAKTDIDDDEEVKGVRKFLVDEDTRIKEAATKLDKDTATFNERAKESQVKAWASEHGVKEEDIVDAEDPEKEALRLKAERLTEEKKAPGSVFESGGGGVAGVQPKDMTDEAFEKHVKGLEMEAEKAALPTR